MTRTPLRAALVGAGRMGAGYADDPVMAKHYPYATHAQVLAAHSAFTWQAVVDEDLESAELARDRYGVPEAARSVGDLKGDVDVVVLAISPERRAAVMDALPDIKGMLVEKPLSSTLSGARAFVDRYGAQRTPVQVNLWRRADTTFRSLAAGDLRARVGDVQSVFVVYGNGLLNNGTHMVDFVRMLLGEAEAVQATGPVRELPSPPLAGDIQVPFHMTLETGVPVTFHPLDFTAYRENAVDIWGTKGRLQIMQEGLSVMQHAVRENRGMQGEREVASDTYTKIASTVGESLFHVYGNLADAIHGQTALWSPLDSALCTASVVDAVMHSARAGNTSVEPHRAG